jgi:CO/xanthine dehydrogenase Mo-binding subunit
MREQIMGRFVGARVRRVEDRRLLSGRGRYVDDVVVPDMASAVSTPPVPPPFPGYTRSSPVLTSLRSPTH